MAKVLEFQLKHHYFQTNPRADLRQNGLVGSPCSPRDSQESSPTSRFKSINSSALSFLYHPTMATPIPNQIGPSPIFNRILEFTSLKCGLVKVMILNFEGAIWGHIVVPASHTLESTI